MHNRPLSAREALMGPREIREVERLAQRYARSRNPALREQLLQCHEGLVRHLVSRFNPNSVVDHDDLIQVGLIGLLNALDRFDPARGNRFVTFAVPTIVGVLKRHLRDYSWALKVPRRLRECGSAVRSARAALEARLGRAPTVPELAQAIGIDEERVAESMELDWAYRGISLDARLDECDPVSAWEAVGARDPALEQVDLRETVRQALTTLEPREEFILRRRFFDGASQVQVARQLSLSQMHVSRLERRALTQLSEQLRSAELSAQATAQGSRVPPQTGNSLRDQAA